MTDEQPVAVPRLLTRRDLATMLKVHINTVDSWTRKNVLPTPIQIRVGTKHRLRWEEPEFKRWLAARKRRERREASHVG
jgi:hypothetical protein